MTIKLLIPALAAAALVAACNKQDHTIAAGEPGNDTPAPEAINPAMLPPPILASKTYRCKDNTLVYIDWLGDKLSANIKTDASASPTIVKAPAEGEAMVAEGYSLKGSATASSITVTVPGKGSQSCKA
jgi:hypothetical protein